MGKQGDMPQAISTSRDSIGNIYTVNVPAWHAYSYQLHRHPVTFITDATSEGFASQQLSSVSLYQNTASWRHFNKVKHYSIISIQIW